MELYKIFTTKGYRRAGTVYPESTQEKKFNSISIYRYKDEALATFPESWQWYLDENYYAPIFDINLCVTNGLIFSETAYESIKNQFPEETEFSHSLTIDNVKYYWVLPKTINDNEIDVVTLNYFKTVASDTINFSKKFINVWKSHNYSSSGFINTLEKIKPSDRQKLISVSASKGHLRKLITRNGFSEKEMSPDNAARTMFDFFEKYQANDHKYDCDNIMMCQWGPMSYKNKEVFLFSIARQFTQYDMDEEGDVYPINSQTEITYMFPISEKLTRIGSGSVFCTGKNELIKFSKSVISTEAFQALKHRTDYMHQFLDHNYVY